MPEPFRPLVGMLDRLVYLCVTFDEGGVWRMNGLA